MKKKIKFLGINFRSKQHLNWFKFSAVMFTASIILLIISLFCRIIPDDPVLRIWIFVLAYMHGLAFLIAFGGTQGGKIFDERLSIDCIRFNGAMTIVYIVLLLLIILLQG